MEKIPTLTDGVTRIIDKTLHIDSPHYKIGDVVIINSPKSFFNGRKCIVVGCSYNLKLLEEPKNNYEAKIITIRGENLIKIKEVDND